METAHTNITLVPIRQIDGSGLHALFCANQDHLRIWHPWVEVQKDLQETERLISNWQRQMEERQNVHLGIWCEGRLCGILGTSRIDWQNRATWLSYSLEQQSQGRGIMTRSCRILLAGIFETLKLNRATIECAPENKKSCAVAERLGFRQEGVLRQVEWLRDHFADHVIYGLLKAEWEKNRCEDISPIPSLSASEIIG